MVKNHLKRPAAPKTWPITRKGITFITRPNPGAHSFNLGVPMIVVFRDLLELCFNVKELKYMLHHQEIIVNGKRVQDHRFMIGFMDVVSLPLLDKYYRILLGENGKLNAVEIEKKEANIVLSKIINKKLISGKTQLNFLNGRNVLVDKDVYKVGDTLVLEVPSQKIAGDIKFDKGIHVFLIGSKNIGLSGTVEDLEYDSFTFKSGQKTYKTARKYAFVVGKDKAQIKIK